VVGLPNPYSFGRAVVIAAETGQTVKWRPFSRPHRGRNLRTPRPDQPTSGQRARQVTRRTVLGGLINEYQPAA